MRFLSSFYRDMEFMLRSHSKHKWMHLIGTVKNLIVIKASQPVNIARSSTLQFKIHIAILT